MEIFISSSDIRRQVLAVLQEGILHLGRGAVVIKEGEKTKSIGCARKYFILRSFRKISQQVKLNGVQR